jgi:hypothetical protein
MHALTWKDYLIALALAALLAAGVMIDNQGMTPAEVRQHP